MADEKEESTLESVAKEATSWAVSKFSKLAGKVMGALTSLSDIQSNVESPQMAEVIVRGVAEAGTRGQLNQVLETQRQLDRNSNTARNAPPTPPQKNGLERLVDLFTSQSEAAETTSGRHSDRYSPGRISHTAGAFFGGSRVGPGNAAFGAAAGSSTALSSGARSGNSSNSGSNSGGGNGGGNGGGGGNNNGGLGPGADYGNGGWDGPSSNVGSRGAAERGRGGGGGDGPSSSGSRSSGGSSSPSGPWDGGGYGRSGNGPGSSGGGSSGGSSSGGSDPIVVDLDDDGVELVAVEDSTARFFSDSDGFKYRSGWAAADDGLLVYDKDDDGNITANDEVSFVEYVIGQHGEAEALRLYDGDSDGVLTDMEALHHFDSNNNGKLDSGDAEFSKFKIWKDADQDGVSDSGEVNTLAHHNLRDFTLSHNADSPAAATSGGNTVHGLGSFTRVNDRGSGRILAGRHHTDHSGVKTALPSVAGRFGVDYVNAVPRRGYLIFASL